MLNVRSIYIYISNILDARKCKRASPVISMGIVTL